MANKRIVICCDGTWNNPEQKFVTNVIKLARVVSPVDSNGIQQVVFYDWGVGSSKDVSDRIKGGAFGKGLDKNIQDAYRFIVHNYYLNDELYLFGFSRGAYTARSLAGFIRNVGILKKKHASLIPKAYNMYRSKTKPDSPTAKKFRRTYSHATLEIKFVGVWDTVGSLGVPIKVLNFLNKKYAFHDTSISRIIKCARHAVAIDEKRDDFKPTLWNVRDSNQDVKQVWFAGVHGDVGGGYEKKGLSDIAFKWMIDEAKAARLAFDNSYVSKLVKPNFLGKQHKSWTGGYWFLGTYTRDIGVFGLAELHPSVKKRWNGNPKYRSKNLKKYLTKYPW
jgi:uncharacterized protein (DUF2235 family)